MVVSLKEEGQSILEFLLLLPILIGMAVILVRLNTAIQVGIVNQQYSRSQVLFLTYNSPFYPELSKQPRLISTSSNQMIVGVSDNVAGSAEYQPRATVQLISRNPKIQGPDSPKEEPQLRGKVRIRNTVTLCTQTLFTQSAQGGSQPILLLQGSNPPRAAGPVALNEGTRFNNICRSAMKYEQ
jgi:hypothetical protein